MRPIRTEWPAWSLLGGAPYTPAHSTNLRELFRREREKQERERAERERMEAHERDAEEA